MIGSGLKKLAAQYNMTVAHGMAYGVMKGYYTSMDEGGGWKRVTIAAKFTDPTKQGEFLALINDHPELKQQYRLLGVTALPYGIIITFHDNPGTMKCITAFLDWLMPLLPRYGLTGEGVCPYCGLELMGSGSWKCIGTVAGQFHAPCASKLESETNAHLEQGPEEEGGSYLTGFVGALIGGLIGAILWGLLLNAGYIAAIVGFVIGWLAEKGYTLLRGKKGGGKLAILIVVAILSVAVGTVLGIVFSLVSSVSSGELSGWTYGDIPRLMGFLLTDTVFLVDTLKDMAMGLIFAALGIYGLLRRTGAANRRVKMKDL